MLMGSANSCIGSMRDSLDCIASGIGDSLNLLTKQNIIIT